MEAITQRYVVYAVWIFVLSLAGGLLPLLRRWSDAQLQALVSLSAGLLLGIVFLDIFPSAGGVGASFYAWVLLGFLLLLAMEKFLLLHPHEAEDIHNRRSGWSAYFGISLHSLVDGIALGSSTMLPELGPVLLMAILAHKIPSTFSLASILLYFDFGRRRTFLLVLGFATLTPIGGLLALLALRHADGALLENAVGLAAGTFLFIATSDLLPHAHAHAHPRKRLWNLVAVVAGVWLAQMLHRFELPG